MKSIDRIPSKLNDLLGGEWNLCIICTSFALLGNCWLVLLGVPAQMLMAYATVSSAFALLANLTAATRHFAKRA